MKMSKDQKKETLMSSFEMLKENCTENEEAIKKIISEMLKLDKNTAIEMWEYILKKNAHLIKSTYMYYLTEGIILYGSAVIGQVEIENIIIGSNILKKGIFKHALAFKGNAAEIISNKIKQNELSIANELLELAYNNKYREWTFYNVLDSVIPYEGSITQEAFDLLTMWIEKINNKQEKAKLNLKMIDFIEEV